jgi:hypothetical protein
MNSFDPVEGAGSESFGFVGNPEKFDMSMGGLYGTVPKRETYMSKPGTGVNHRLLSICAGLLGVTEVEVFGKIGSERIFKGIVVTRIVEVTIKML